MILTFFPFSTCFRYDYLPYFYSRVFEYEGSTRKVWWQFYGDNGNILQMMFSFKSTQIFFKLRAFCFVLKLIHIFILIYEVGETIEVGSFDPKIATFWVDSGKSYVKLFYYFHIILHLYRVMNFITVQIVD